MAAEAIRTLAPKNTQAAFGPREDPVLLSRNRILAQVGVSSPRPFGIRATGESLNLSEQVAKQRPVNLAVQGRVALQTVRQYRMQSESLMQPELGFAPVAWTRLSNAFAESVPHAAPDAEPHDAVLGAVKRLHASVDEGVAPWAEKPREQAFNDAEDFVRAWEQARVVTPHVGIADDGEVNFLWKHDGRHVDLGFYGDGTYSYFARDYNGERYWNDDVPVGEGLTVELRRILVDQD